MDSMELKEPTLNEEEFTKGKKLHCDYRTFLKLFGNYHSKVFTKYLGKLKTMEGLIYYDTYYDENEDDALYKQNMSVFTWKLDLEKSDVSIVPETIRVEDIKLKRKFIKRMVSCEDV